MPADPQATYLSAFTGIGGLDLGLEAAGFTSIGCIEMDETACRSIKANRSGVWTLLSPGDITELSKSLRPKSLGLEPRELGVLSGGPPCQPFSKAGQWSTSSRTGLLDPRSRCLDGMLDLVQHFQPLVMLIENVGGFVSGPTSAWSKLIERLNRINALCATNYQPQCRILDAADFGVPQKRRRGSSSLQERANRSHGPSRLTLPIRYRHGAQSGHWIPGARRFPQSENGPIYFRQFPKVVTICGTRLEGEGSHYLVTALDIGPFC